MQRQEIDPINKHKSEIERRLNQLQNKFSQTSQIVNKNQLIAVDKSHLPSKYTKETKRVNLYDGESERPGKMVQHLINNKGMSIPLGNENEIMKQNINKTLDMRNISRVNDQANPKKDYHYEPKLDQYNHHKQRPLQPLISNQQIIDQEKDKKIQQLQNMIRSILDGQKHLQKQLLQLKTKVKAEEDMNRLFASKEKDQKTMEQGNPYQKDKKTKNIINTNQLSKEHLQISQKNKQQMNISNNAQCQTKEKKIAKRSTPLKSKQRQFELLYQQLKCKDGSNQRKEISQDLKSHLWSEVEYRIRESDREYKDTLHRNSKHEFEHLMNTFELQRKLKDELIDKVYELSNNLVYK